MSTKKSAWENGDEMLRNDSNRVLTHEETIELFRNFEKIEHKLYRKILSFKPFTTRFLEELLQFMTIHDAEKVVDVTDDLKCLIIGSVKHDAAFKSDLDAFCLRLIALDGPRYVSRLATKLVNRAAADDYEFHPQSKWSEREHTIWHRQVVRLFNEAHEIKNRLVASNQGLVGVVVKRYRSVSSTAFAIADMQQEGSLGLYRAIDKFEWRRGLRFSTYATWWIRHHVSRAVGDKSALIRLPIHMDDSIKQIKRFCMAFETQNGRPPTIPEIQKATNLRQETVKYAVEGRISMYSIDADIKGTKNSSLSTGEGRSFHDLTPDTNAVLASEDLEKKQVRGILLRAIENLSLRDQEVVRYRFGIGVGGYTDEEKTLNEVGIKYNLSRERIRQIQTEVLGKLRRAISNEIPHYPN